MWQSNIYISKKDNMFNLLSLEVLYKMKKKEFNKLVGFSSIVGAVATIIATLISIFAQNQDLKSADTTISQNNINNADTILNNSGDVQIYNAEGDQYIYNQVNTDDNTIDNSETLLYQRLKDKVTEEILCFVSDDFDDDGKIEAFALVGHEEMDVWKGCPFFINETSIAKLTSDTMLKLEWDQAGYRQTFRKVFFGKQKAVVFSLWAMNSYRDEAYGIINGEPMQFSIPDVEGGFKVTENFITLTVDAFDGCCFENFDWGGGHTWKPYYFFWNDGLNSFSEYGGIEITLEQLSKIKDVSRLMNQYYEDDYSLINIIYRANKIININFRKSESESVYSHVNVTLYIQNDSIYLSDEAILEKNAGYYLIAIKPEIAVYPEFPY